VETCSLSGTKFLLTLQLWDVLPQEKGEELAKQLNFSGYISVDVTSPDSAEASAKKTLELLDGTKLVGCVHCAGIALRVSTESRAGAGALSPEAVANYEPPSRC
jgi:hypothetical protein